MIRTSTILWLTGFAIGAVAAAFIREVICEDDRHEELDHKVEIASEDSFPASDPPAFTR